MLANKEGSPLNETKQQQRECTRAAFREGRRMDGEMGENRQNIRIRPVGIRVFLHAALMRPGGVTTKVCIAAATDRFRF